MEPSDSPSVRNLAVVGHVDHGKTSLVDAMLWQSGLLVDAEAGGPSLADAIDPQREKRIAVMSPVTSMTYRGTRVNLVDLPGHAAIAGDVDRALAMVEGLLYVVDAVEGPVPQVRSVLRKALEAGLNPIVVVNKVDLPDSRPLEVLEEVRALFADLDAAPAQLHFPVLYTNARSGVCARAPGRAGEPLLALFDEILRAVPPPAGDARGAASFLVTSLDYDDFLGRLALGSVRAGTLRPGAALEHRTRAGGSSACEISGIFGFTGTARVEVPEAGPGDIVAVSGIAAVRVGDVLAAGGAPALAVPFRVDEPTLTVLLEINDSPTAGLEASRSGGPALRERLWREILTNDAVRIEEADSPDAFRLTGRGELQLTILLEMMRREGYEMLVGPPHVVTRESDGRRQEPMEQLILDCPERLVGVVTDKVTARRGRLTKMVNHGTGRVRMEFRVPSRGLIGFRGEFLNDTRGAGILSHRFDGFADWAGEVPARSTGALVADRPGRVSASAVAHLQSRGALFVAPGEGVYEGMIVGENSRASDLWVNVTKQTPAAAAAGEPSPRTAALIPPRSLSLEQGLEFIRDDERVELTPRSLRLRKKELSARARAGRA